MPSGSQQLRQWIDRRGVNQREAAGLLGLNEVVLSQLLSGKRQPGLANAIRIERVTGISVESWLQSELSDASSDASADPRKAKHNKV